MPQRFQLARLAPLLLLVAAGPAAAPPDPFADIQASLFTPSSQYSAAEAHDTAGNALVVWAATAGTAGAGIYGRRFAAGGRALGPELNLVSATLFGSDPVALVSSARGYILAWAENLGGEGTVCVERLDFDARAAGERHCVAGTFQPRLAVQADGRFMLTSVSLNDRSPLRAWLFDSGANAIGKPLFVAESGYSLISAVDAAGGFLVVWTDSRGVWGRRFDRAGGLRGAAFRIAEQGNYATEAVGDGRGLVRIVWESFNGVQMRSFVAGRPTTGPVVVIGSDFFGASGPRAAMLADGRTLVAWSDFVGATEPTRVMGRLFSSFGRPASPPFRLSHSSHDDSLEGVAVSPNGRFLVTFYRLMVEENHDDIWLREVRWATPGDEPCLYRQGRFACDLRHGSPPDPVELRFAGAPGDVPLLGDVDGDHLVEACVVRGTRLLCDVGHDGGAAELALDLGYGTAAGDVPLLGDLDGEGRADPCIHRSDRFLCDTAHNGGTAEVIVRFGEPADVPFLADIDGDGDADPCVLHDRVLACDTVHDGGLPEVLIPFDANPAAGDVPLLGDLDGDGRVDPCVFRAGEFLCDPERTGLFTISIPPAGAGGGIPLLGDVDGIGGKP